MAVSPGIPLQSSPLKGISHDYRHHRFGRNRHSLRPNVESCRHRGNDLSNSRGPDSLKELVLELGPSIRAGTREEAARGDIVFVAVNWTKLRAAIADLPNWKGRIVIDANNPIEAPLFKPADLGGRVSSEVFADLVPGARVAKAFNHLRAELLASDPSADGGRRVLFYSGNDTAAKGQIAALIERIGFAGIDLGSLAVGGKLAQFPGGPLPNQNLVKIG